MAGRLPSASPARGQVAGPCPVVSAGPSGAAAAAARAAVPLRAGTGDVLKIEQELTPFHG
jgi:hypothetical protein